jgi:hypothetical protein
VAAVVRWWWAHSSSHGVGFAFPAGIWLPASSSGVVGSIGGTRWRAADPFCLGQQGAAGSFWAVECRAPPVGQPVFRHEKQLHMGAARWLCSGHRPERSAWFETMVMVGRF